MNKFKYKIHDQVYYISGHNADDIAETVIMNGKWLYSDLAWASWCLKHWRLKCMFNSLFRTAAKEILKMIL